MKRVRSRQQAAISVIFAVIVVILIGVVVVGGSIRLLPDAPLFPTATPPKGIEFPDSRPVPAQR